MNRSKGLISLPPDIDAPPNPPKNMLNISSGVISAMKKKTFIKIILHVVVTSDLLHVQCSQLLYHTQCHTCNHASKFNHTDCVHQKHAYKITCSRQDQRKSQFTITQSFKQSIHTFSCNVCMSMYLGSCDVSINKIVTLFSRSANFSHPL